MPKKIKKCFYEKLTFQKLLEAHYRARKHKTYKNEVILFELNLENNIINLLNRIKNNKYTVGKYYEFKVFDPKERVIHALPYIDRIVHQWYVEEFIKPFIVPKFVNTSFACLENKGTHKAVLEVQKQLCIYKRNHGDFWILKCDIKNFFIILILTYCLKYCEFLYTNSIEMNKKLEDELIGLIDSQNKSFS